MDGHKYEHAVAQFLRHNGYSNVIVTRASGDYGADIIATKRGRKYAIQCKYYSNPVGLKAVQEVVASKKHYRCSRAMVVTNNTYTKAARRLAEENGTERSHNVRIGAGHRSPGAAQTVRTKRSWRSLAGTHHGIL